MTRPPADQRDRVRVRPTEERDFDGIIEVCRRVYPGQIPYLKPELESHLRVFPQGQLTAITVDGTGRERVAGMAASLIVTWDDYAHDPHWMDFTADATFTNHDPAGRTLYGAEIMVHPEAQGQGVGSALYRERDALMRRLALLRIRAGARLRGYGAHADRMTADEYVEAVIGGELQDPTLTFQLNRGFRVLRVVDGYLPDDPASHGWAALIEKPNPDLAGPEDLDKGDPRFRQGSSRAP